MMVELAPQNSAITGSFSSVWNCPITIFGLGLQHVPLIKNEAFLMQHFIEKKRSIDEIVTLTFSSKRVVKRQLMDFGLLQEEKTNFCKGQVGFGEKLVKGQIVPHVGELNVIEEMKGMRAEGYSYQKIADWLNLKKMPTKNGKNNWSRTVVYKILNKNI